MKIQNKKFIYLISPNKIKNKRVIDEVSISYDIFPTISELSGVDELYTYSTDGVSLVDIFTDKKNSLERDYIYWEFPSYGGQQAARMGHYKAILKDIKNLFLITLRKRLK